MSKASKRLERLKTRPSDFTWAELKAVLADFGYAEMAQSGGSRRCFLRSEVPSGRIFMHKPHPDDRMRGYQLKQVIEELTVKGFI